MAEIPRTSLSKRERIILTEQIYRHYRPPFGPIITYPWKLITRLPHQTDCPKIGVRPASIIVRETSHSGGGCYCTRVQVQDQDEDEDEDQEKEKEVYEFYAKTALTHYNSNEGRNLTFLRLVNKCIYICGPRCYVHLNFTATADNHGGGGDDDYDDDDAGGGGVYDYDYDYDGEGSPLFFYAEVLRITEESEESEDREDETEDERKDEEFILEVTGCSLIKKVDTGNPVGMQCGKCDCSSVIHPGPYSGYRVVCGETFESSDFMRYNPHNELMVRQPNSPLVRSAAIHLAKRLPMFTSCGRQALKHFNQEEKSKFQLVKVKYGFSVATPFERTVHLNFLAKWPEKSKKSKFFFAVAVVPMLTAQRLNDWDTFLERYIVVEGCCRLSKRGLGSYFGRCCDMCINGVIHPGPRDGYEIVAGDSFEDAQFMELGNGIF